MSRFDSGDDYDENYPNQFALWERSQTNALKGKKGQAFLAEVEAALLALPERKLTDTFAEGGQVCALGAVALKRRVEQGEPLEQALEDLERLGYDSASDTAWFAMQEFRIPQALAWAIAYENDEGAGVSWPQSPRHRWERMWRWCRRLQGKDEALPEEISGR